MTNTFFRKISSVSALVALLVVSSAAVLFLPNTASAASSCGPTTTTIVSDSSVTVDGGANAVPTYNGNPGWTVSIPGATWIWDTPFVIDSAVDHTVNFAKPFSVSGTVTNATLSVAADNTYTFNINGTTVSSDTTGHTFNQPANSIDVTSAIVNGSNTINATVTNIGIPGSGGPDSPKVNPAGLLFSLTITTNNCPTAPTKGTLTVINNVINDNSGTSTASDFTVNVTGTNVSNATFPGSTIGTSTTIDPGAYNVTETGDSGYTQTFSADCSGTIAAGDNKTCTITDNDIAPSGGGGGSTPLVCDPTVNLLANPDFETPTITDPGLWQIFPNGTPNLGWIVDFVSPQTTAPGLELQSGYTASTGTQYAELDGLQHPESIYQDIQTIPGDQYELSFDFSPRPGTDATRNQLGVTFDGNSVANLSADGTIGLAKFNTVWTNYDYQNLLPTTATTRVQFSDLASDDSLGLGTFLDNVSLRCIGPASTNGGGGNGGGGTGGGTPPAVLSSSVSGGGSGSQLPQGEVLGASTSCGEYLTKYMRLGYTNDRGEVIKLQAFLDTTMNAGLTISGTYTKATELAVEKFQAAHADTTLIPWGITAPTGIVYQTTKTEINNLMCNDLKLPIPAPLINWSQAVDTQKN